MVRNFNMRSGAVLSVGGHIVLLLFAQFGLPNLFTPPPVSLTVIPVDVVTVDDLNVPPPPATPEPEPEPEPELAAAAPQPPPPPPQAPPEPPQAVEAPPPPPPDKPKPPAKTPPPPEPEAKPPEPEPAPPKLARAEPRTKPKPPAPRRDFASVLKDLARREENAPAPKAREPAKPEDKGEPTPARQAAVEPPSITEIERLKQMIRRQIEPCWSPPVGAAEARDLVVTIFIRVDRRGFVRDARIVDAPMMALNTYFQAAADAARRAVLNPRCQPFELPAERYDLWKEIRFNFDPREMLG